MKNLIIIFALLSINLMANANNLHTIKTIIGDDLTYNLDKKVMGISSNLKLTHIKNTGRKALEKTQNGKLRLKRAKIKGFNFSIYQIAYKNGRDRCYIQLEVSKESDDKFVIYPYSKMHNGIICNFVY